MTGCPSRDISSLDIHPAGEILKDVPLSTDIDILFMIDNSSSTTDKQTLFAANFPRFIQALDAFPNGRPNVHIGVVSSTVDIGVGGFDGCPHPSTNDDGIMQSMARVPGCTPPTGRYIVDVKDPSGGRMTNYSGTLASTFACIAQLGDLGCGFEAQLEAVKRALDGSHPENAGFLRPSAFLAVVILTDEDDCSVRDPAIFSLPEQQVGALDFRCQPMFSYTCDQPISPSGPGTYTNCFARTDSYLEDPNSFTQFLIDVKGGLSRVVVALIGGPPTKDIMTGQLVLPNITQPLALLPSCTTTIGGRTAVGRPGIRLNRFLTPFGGHGLFRTVCQSDYSQALADIGELLFTAVAPCLEGEVNTTDVEPSEPGLQLNCSVTDVLNVATPQQTETVIPRCPMTGPTTPSPSGPRPCWWVQSDPASCPTPTKLALRVERTSAPAPNTTERVRCIGL
ncbi:MAG TPA: hypothetical protein VKE22_13475 [Haliangiales bacterium]|nr:hypothetical protein [Haliangiales bacterium]